MVSQVLLTTLFVGALLSYQVAPVTSCGWHIDLFHPKPKPQPKCPFNLFGAIGKGLADLGKGIGNVAAGVGKGVGDIVHGVGEGCGHIIEGVGAGVGQAVNGIGQGCGHIIAGVGHGLGDVAVGVGQGAGHLVAGVGAGAGHLVAGVGAGLGNIAAGVGAGLGSVALGLGQCLLDVGHGIGLGLHALFHGCHWHVHGHNHGAIRIGLPGHSHLTKNIQNGPHITFTSSYANGKGKITFYFTLAMNGHASHQLKKSYSLIAGSSHEVSKLFKKFVHYVKSHGKHVEQKAPQASGNIVWSTKRAHGKTIIKLTYSQYSGNHRVLSKTKSYVLCSGSQEAVRDAISHFKNDLQSGAI